jgi:hypothetical protein
MNDQQLFCRTPITQLATFIPMTIAEIIIALTIHLILPLAGLLWFLRIKKQMKNNNVSSPPTIELFLIFSTFGGLLLVALTALFGWWSGTASLGAFYLLLVAPIVMGIVSYRHRKTKEISRYHKWTYLSGLLYFAIAPLTFGLLILLETTVGLK